LDGLDYPHHCSDWSRSISSGRGYVVALLLNRWHPSADERLGFATYCGLVFFIDLCIVVALAGDRSEETENLGRRLDNIAGKLDTIQFQLDEIGESLNRRLRLVQQGGTFGLGEMAKKDGYEDFQSGFSTRSIRSKRLRVSVQSNQTYSVNTSGQCGRLAEVQAK